MCGISSSNIVGDDDSVDGWSEGCCAFKSIANDIYGRTYESGGGLNISLSEEEQTFKLEIEVQASGVRDRDRPINSINRIGKD